MNEEFNVEEEVEVELDNEEEVSTEVEVEDTESKVEPIKRDKVQERINKVIKEKHELQRVNEELQKRLEGSDTNNYSPEVIESLVREQAIKLANENSFNDRCNSIFKEGVDKYPEFSNSVTTLNNIGLSSNKELFNSIVESDNPSDILEYLANNLDEAEKFMEYSSSKMIRELTKLDINLAGVTSKTKPISKVPSPIKPISGKTIPVKVSAETNAKAWIQQRNRDLAGR